MSRLVLIFVFCVGPMAGAGVVQTRDGRFFEGNVRFNADSVQVTPKDIPGGFALNYPLADVTRITLKPLPTGVLSGGALAGGWSVADVGSIAVAGSADYQQGTFTLRGEGARLGEKSDAFHFVFQRLASDGQIVARVWSLSDTDPLAKAGLMVRSTLGAESRYCMVALTAGEGAKFYAKNSTDLNAIVTPGKGPKLKPPYWLKLRKFGDNVVGSVSPDRKAWEVVGSFSVEGMRESYIGLVVTSNKADELATANFDGVLATLHGLKGEYFADDKFQNLRHTQMDSAVDFAWRQVPPAPNMPVDGFTVRWTGQLYAPTEDNYHFQFRVNGKARLSIFGRPVLDTAHSGDIKLTNRKYDIQVDYYKNAGGDGECRLYWSTDTQPEPQPVPTEHLFFPPPDPVPTGGAANNPVLMSRGTPTARGVLLADGTFLPGAPMSADRETLTFQYKHRDDLKLPLDKIARVTFLPLNSIATARIPPRSTGILTQAGDFVEGELDSIADGKVRLSSVVFGMNTYDVETQTAALVFRDTAPLSAAWIVNTVSGGTFHFTAIRPDQTDLIGTSPLLGEFRLHLSEILDISAEPVVR